MNKWPELKSENSASETENRERVLLLNDLHIEFVDLQDEDEDLALAMNCSNG